MLLFPVICIIINFVKEFTLHKFFTINNPLLIIYTPLERSVAPLPVFLLQLFRAMQNFKKNCESCSHERIVLLEILYARSHIEMQRSGIEMWL